MAFHTHQIKTNIGGQQITAEKTSTYEGQIGTEVSVPGSTTDKEVIIAIDVSQVKSITMKATGALKVETNNGTTPDDTIDLVADWPYVWTEHSYDALLLGTDVTKLFLTNAGGTAVTFTIDVIYDPTP